MAIALAGCTVHRDPPELDGQDIRLTIIHTSDIHSRLFPYYLVPNRFDQGYGLIPDPGQPGGMFGGVAEIAAIVKRERAEAARSLWLDSGDCFQGAPVFNMFKGEAEMRALTAAGMDGEVVGNHEFDQGTANLIYQIENWAGYPMLVANYAFDDPPSPLGKNLGDVTQPFQIYDVDGIKIGVIGMGNWSSMTSIFEGGNSLGVRALDDQQVLDQYVRLLRPEVDVLIVLSHLGLDEDEGLAQDSEDEGTPLIPLTDVDLVLGGHLHIVLDPPKELPYDRDGDGVDDGRTLLVHSGAFAKFVGRLDLVIHVGSDNADPDTRSRISAYSFDVIPVDKNVTPDPDIADILWPYSLAINREIDLDGVIAFSAVPPGEKILRADTTGGDSAIGNMVARAMQVRSGVEAELAITNSLGIRADFESGPLTVEQMYNVFPFENQITVMYLSGGEIQETLDFVARKSAGRGCRAQAQVAGITFDMVCSGTCPDGRTACAKNLRLGDGKKCRVGGDPNGEVITSGPDACPPLDPNGLYRVAVNDYISRGGSGFDVLKRNSSKQDTGISLRDATVDFLRRQPKCTTQQYCTDPQGNCGSAPLVTDVFGDVACLDPNDPTFESHDGRIRAVFE
ncbi:MAG TPA: bifunctional UDP-sugar hydrolase/5'-nucleotidase [Kofleriaceae bacterium]|nr:bifunctional UDP-sugar hydrolase/5'-nucleotidase [Kofleriaceae bacterium]